MQYKVSHQEDRRGEAEDCVVRIITEPWLKDNVPDAAVQLAGCSMFTADRMKDSGKKRGGGLCVYVNSNVVPGSSAAFGVFAEGADLEEYLLRYICWELKEAKQQAQTMQRGTLQQQQLPAFHRQGTISSCTDVYSTVRV